MCTFPNTTMLMCTIIFLFASPSTLSASQSCNLKGEIKHFEIKLAAIDGYFSKLIGVKYNFTSPIILQVIKCPQSQRPYTFLRADTNGMSLGYLINYGAYRYGLLNNTIVHHLPPPKHVTCILNTNTLAFDRCRIVREKRRQLKTSKEFSVYSLRCRSSDAVGLLFYNVIYTLDGVYDNGLPLDAYPLYSHSTIEEVKIGMCKCQQRFNVNDYSQISECVQYKL